MGRKYELTWDKSRKRWKKYYRGVQYYFAFGTSKTDSEGYQLALEAWKKKKAALDAARQQEKPHRVAYEKAIKARLDLSTWCRQAGDFDQAKVFQSEADRLLDRFNRLDEPPPLSPVEADPLSSVVQEVATEMGAAPIPDWHKLLAGELNVQYGTELPTSDPDPEALDEVKTLRAVWDDRLRRVGAVEPDKTVGAAIDRYLSRMDAKVKNGDLSGGYYGAVHAHFKRFGDFLGRASATETIVAKSLMDYHTYLLGLVGKGEITRTYAHNNMNTVRRFIRWAWSLELCNLPRNINSSDLRFNTTTAEIVTFSKDEVKLLLSGASERTQLYVLLALNCAYTQRDIASLKHEEVDFSKGTITRKRSKTQDQKTVPTVCYPLWRKTLVLLKKHSNPASEFVLTNAKGKPLWGETITDGEYAKKDTIRSAFARLTHKLKTKKRFKHLRKTGASMLETHEVYRGFVGLYLGHAPKSIAEKHYAAPSMELFAQAIRWLGKQFRLA